MLKVRESAETRSRTEHVHTRQQQGQEDAGWQCEDEEVSESRRASERSWWCRRVEFELRLRASDCGRHGAGYAGYTPLSAQLALSHCLQRLLLSWYLTARLLPM